MDKAVAAIMEVSLEKMINPIGGLPSPISTTFNTNKMKKLIVFALISFSAVSCENPKKDVSDSEYNQAISSFQAGKYGEALKLATKIIDFRQGNLLLANAKYLRGYIYQIQDSVEMAYKDLLEARQLYFVDRNIKGQSKSANQLGHLCYHIDLHRYALNYYKESFDLAESIGSTKLISNSLYGIARTHKRLGNLDKALTTMYEVLALEAELERHQYFIDCLFEIAEIFDIVGSYEISLERNWQAINSSTGTPLEKATKSKAYYNIADIYLDQLELEKAKIYLDSSLNQNFLSSKDSAIVFNNLGRWYHAIGNDFKAADCFRISLEKNQFKTDMLEVVETRSNLQLLKASGLSIDSLILCYEALVNVSVPDFIIREKIEQNELRLKIESLEHELNESSEQEESILKNWIFWLMLLFMLISAMLIIKLMRQRKMNRLSTLTEDHLSFMREREKIRKRWQERLKN